MPTWEDRGKRVAEEFEAKPGRTVAKVVAALIAVGIVLSAVGWVLSWGGEAARITGVENTRDQAFALRDSWTSMEAAAANACDVKAAAPDATAPTLVEDPVVAYRATYRRIKAEYDRRMSNAFEAGWVRKYPFLNDLPRVAPTLKQMQAEVC